MKTGGEARTGLHRFGRQRAEQGEPAEGPGSTGHAQDHEDRGGRTHVSGGPTGTDVGLLAALSRKSQEISLSLLVVLGPVLRLLVITEGWRW